MTAELETIAHSSPNHGSRRLPVAMLVLHYTGMESAAAALARLCDPAAEVSAHYLIDEDGTAYALVGEDRRAWHAGAGAWRGWRDVNSASIGIELVNPGHDLGYRAFPEAQMAALETLCRAILSRHAIAPRDVVGHSDVHNRAEILVAPPRTNITRVDAVFGQRRRERLVPSQEQVAVVVEVSDDGHRDAPINQLYTIHNDLKTMRMITAVDGPSDKYTAPPVPQAMGNGATPAPVEVPVTTWQQKDKLFS